MLKLNDVEGILLALRECSLMEMTSTKQINCGRVSEGKNQVCLERINRGT